MLTLESLREYLREGTVIVTFTKMNGDTRNMKCTTNSEIMPQMESTTRTSKRTVPDDMLVVWDLESQGWRSFHFNQVTMINVVA